MIGKEDCSKNVDKNHTIISSFLGHKGRCFDTRLSHDYNSFISASEDGCAKIWSLQNKKCLFTLKHNDKCEVLRSAFVTDTIVCTGGSDGKVIIWKRNESDNLFVKSRSLMHNSAESQIYACEPVPSQDSGRLITAADCQLFMWDLESTNDRCVQSWSFDSLDQDAINSVPFGGPRNEQNEVYVFDAKVSPTVSSCVAVALSDSSIRLLDTREGPDRAVVSTMPLNKQQRFANQNFGHATSVSIQ